MKIATLTQGFSLPFFLAAIISDPFRILNRFRFPARALGGAELPFPTLSSR